MKKRNGDEKHVRHVPVDCPTSALTSKTHSRLSREDFGRADPSVSSLCHVVSPRGLYKPNLLTHNNSELGKPLGSLQSTNTSPRPLKQAEDLVSLPAWEPPLRHPCTPLARDRHAGRVVPAPFLSFLSRGNKHTSTNNKILQSLTWQAFTANQSRASGFLHSGATESLSY